MHLKKSRKTVIKLKTKNRGKKNKKNKPDYTENSDKH